LVVPDPDPAAAPHQRPDPTFFDITNDIIFASLNLKWSRYGSEIIKILVSRSGIILSGSTTLPLWHARESIHLTEVKYHAAFSFTCAERYHVVPGVA
jgi:hypothetical protein